MKMEKLNYTQKELGFVVGRMINSVHINYQESIKFHVFPPPSLLLFRWLLNIEVNADNIDE